MSKPFEMRSNPMIAGIPMRSAADLKLEKIKKEVAGTLAHHWQKGDTSFVELLETLETIEEILDGKQ